MLEQLTINITKAEAETFDQASGLAGIDTVAWAIQALRRAAIKELSEIGTADIPIITVWAAQHLGAPRTADRMKP